MPDQPNSSSARPPEYDGEFSLTALFLTVLFFCLVDGAIVLLFSLKDHSLANGFGMLVVIGGPFGLAFGKRVYKRIKREMNVYYAP